MKTANINIRINPNVKENAENLYSQFGITLTDAISMFLNQSLIVGGLPFELKQPRYNAVTEAAMQEVRDIESGKVEAKIFDTVEDMIRELNVDP